MKRGFIAHTPFLRQLQECVLSLNQEVTLYYIWDQAQTQLQIKYNQHILVYASPRLLSVSTLSTRPISILLDLEKFPFL